MTKPILKILNNQSTHQTPFWFMRQAGRYLPEYRELRSQAGGFLDLVYNPEQSSEVTLQPIRRFGMSAAILFSDILVIPQSLGQNLKFETGEGPRLNSIKNLKDINNLNLEKIDNVLSPIYETVSLTKSKLKTEKFYETALIGFAGSPWTVACYMVEGRGNKIFNETIKFSRENTDEFQKIIDILVRATSHYLIKQIDAGAEVIQLFDSWAGLLQGVEFDRWVIEPTVQIIQNVRVKHPNIPVIGFPREANDNVITYAEKTDIQAIGLDYSMKPEWARDNLQSLLPVQGNLDPEILLAGGKALDEQAHKILEIFADKPFIFNLGHGVIKETPPEHVMQLSEIIRNFK